MSATAAFKTLMSCGATPFAPLPLDPAPPPSQRHPQQHSSQAQAMDPLGGEVQTSPSPRSVLAPEVRGMSPRAHAAAVAATASGDDYNGLCAVAVRLQSSDYESAPCAAVRQLPSDGGGAFLESEVISAAEAVDAEAVGADAEAIRRFEEAFEAFLEDRMASAEDGDLGMALPSLRSIDALRCRLCRAAPDRFRAVTDLEARVAEADRLREESERELRSKLAEATRAKKEMERVLKVDLAEAERARERSEAELRARIAQVSRDRRRAETELNWERVAAAMSNSAKPQPPRREPTPPPSRRVNESGRGTMAAAGGSAPRRGSQKASPVSLGSPSKGRPKVMGGTALDAAAALGRRSQPHHKPQSTPAPVGGCPRAYEYRRTSTPTVSKTSSKQPKPKQQPQPQAQRAGLFLPPGGVVNKSPPSPATALAAALAAASSSAPPSSVALTWDDETITTAEPHRSMATSFLVETADSSIDSAVADLRASLHGKG